MKTMRRNGVIVIALIALTFTMALAACDGGGGNAGDSDASGTASATQSEAYALYESASKALDNAEGYTMDIDMDISTGGDSEEDAVDTTATSHIEVSDPAGDIGMKTVQQTDFAGENIETTVYVKDGAMYTEMLGSKIKMTTDISQLVKQSSNMVDFAEDAIIDGSVTDVEGGKQIAFTIKGDALSEYINQQAGDITGGLTGGGADGEDPGEDAAEATEEVDVNSGMTFEDSKITALIGPDGNFVEYTIEMSFAMDFGGIKSSMSQKSTITNIKIGKIEIDFPTDLDSYEELDLGSIGDIE